ncbi:hypothetical protein HII12_001159 [Brettanomyces bruxellensis]|uniref:DEBR0S4_15764g1_1 n=1 Tax=Dekkera bruxellensis TaxID=5007 RepID=A0A7D9D046_DEKBR|nr:hypothetical protein HII12_001159 [Brettanomyces bruxellensis]VUG19319.1 DEBR0S4_15764g1_1 [Brettanomyces bruxellensis]
MPIRTLEPYLFDIKTVNNCPLDVLQNAVIGIDVEHYLSRLFTPKKEPNLEAIGGFPMTLKTLVESDFGYFKELNIKPIFVFSGLKTTIQYDYLEQDDLLAVETTFKRVWDDKTSKNYHIESFRNSDSPLQMRPVMNQLMEFLDSKNVEYIVSPYSAASQLQYMQSEHIIDCIFGSTDSLLLQTTERIIFSIEFEAKQFKYLDRNNVFSNMNLSAKQFQDISMCVGNTFQPFVLEILPQMPTQSTFASLHHFVLNGGSVYNSILALGENSEELERYMKGCASIRYMPILKTNGRVEPPQYTSKASFLSHFTPTSPISGFGQKKIEESSSEKLPEDIHALFGERLPDELFFYQSIGITAFQLFETLIHSNAVERLPLDMSPSELYKKVVTSDETVTLWSEDINIVANPINRYFQYKKLKLTTYFDGAKYYQIDQKIMPPLVSVLGPLLIRHATAKSFDLVSLLSILDNNFLMENTVNPRDNIKISTNFELISTSFVRALVQLGFIERKKFALTSWGEALEFVAHSFHPKYLLLVLLFFKEFPDLEPSDVLNPSDFRSTGKEDTENAILISKFLSLLELNEINPVNYVYRVSRPLLQFRSVASKVASLTNMTITSNLLSLLLLNHVDLDKYQRNNSDWRKLALEIPFRNSLPSVLLGIIAEQFFEGYLDSGNIKESFKFLKESYEMIIPHPDLELIEGLKAFKEVANLVSLLGEKGLLKNESLVSLFGSSEKLVNNILEIS